MAEEKTSSSVSVSYEYELVATNSHVRTLARRLGWKPETLVERVKNSALTEYEQKYYLYLTTRDWKIGMYPETVAKLFRHFNNGQELTPSSFVERASVPRGTMIVWQTFAVFSLVERGRLIGVENAARIVELYGHDGAEDVFDLIEENLNEIVEKTGMARMPKKRALAVVFAVIAHGGSDQYGGGIMPNITTAEDVIALMGRFGHSAVPYDGQDEENG